MIDCKKCTSSGCCRLVIGLTKSEFDSLEDFIKDSCIKSKEKFLSMSPGMSILPDSELDDMFNGLYAEIKKDDDGYCVFLNRKTMLCDVYDYRPKVCADYKTHRCENIRVIQT